MRTQVVLSLAASILLCAASANASSWRDLRIDATTDSRFNDSVQQMRNALPHNRAVLFVLTLKDLKARFASAEYREHLNGLTFEEIVQLGSPSVSTEYLAYFAQLRSKSGSSLASSNQEGFVSNSGGAFPGVHVSNGIALP